MEIIIIVVISVVAIGLLVKTSYDMGYEHGYEKGLDNGPHLKQAIEELTEIVGDISREEKNDR